jgi:hypothetical protein
MLAQACTGTKGFDWGNAMNWARFILASVVGYLVLVAAGGLWHLELFRAFYAQQLAAVARPGPLLPEIAAAEGVRAVGFALVYAIGYRGGPPWWEGLRFGLLMALLSAAVIVITYAQLKVASPAWVWMETAFFVIQCGIVGVVIGYCYGRGERAAESGIPM